MYLIPQIIIDTAVSLNESKHEHMKATYLGRLEAVRDYVTSVIDYVKSQPPTVRGKNTRV